MQKIWILCVVMSIAVACSNAKKDYSPTTLQLMETLENDPQAKQLVETSIAKAATINPDRKTNPVQSLNEFYDYIDWTLTREPWDFFPEDLFHGFAEKTDQSILYPYWLLDQPLEELKDSNFFYPSVEYLTPIRKWLTTYCQAWKEFLDAPQSWNDTFYQMIAAEPSFNLDKGWYESTEEWHSFNDFFSRKLSSPAARPIACPTDESVVVTPADGLPQGVWTIDSTGRFFADAIYSEEGVELKSQTFVTVEQLLADSGAMYASAFYNGTLTHTYLNYDDYHRYHFPISGTIRAKYIVPNCDFVGGVVYWSDSLSRYVLESNSLSWQAYETRGCVIVETEQYGLVAILPIGMGQVSSVNWEPNVLCGAQVKKGDPLGYFLFGGSDCVILFQEQANFELTCPHGGEGSYSNGYAHLFQGQEIGRFH